MFLERPVCYFDEVDPVVATQFVRGQVVNGTWEMTTVICRSKGNEACKCYGVSYLISFIAVLHVVAIISIIWVALLMTTINASAVFVFRTGTLPHGLELCSGPEGERRELMPIHVLINIGFDFLAICWAICCQAWEVHLLVFTFWIFLVVSVGQCRWCSRWLWARHWSYQHLGLLRKSRCRQCGLICDEFSFKLSYEAYCGGVFSTEPEELTHLGAISMLF